MVNGDALESRSDSKSPWRRLFVAAFVDSIKNYYYCCCRLAGSNLLLLQVEGLQSPMVLHTAQRVEGLRWQQPDESQNKVRTNMASVLSVYHTLRSLNRVMPRLHAAMSVLSVRMLIAAMRLIVTEHVIRLGHVI